MANLKIEKIENTDTYAKFEISPFERGFGNTFATPIRRVLLSSIKGTSIVKIKIKGADHEFTSMKGMKEDVLRLVLNLQKVVFRIEGSESEKVILKVKGIKEIKASDIKLPGNVTVLNPELVLAELTDKGAELEIEATVETGYGFEVADDEDRNREPGIIPMNRSFSPVIKVNASVDATRVGQKTDYEKIVLEIWTNGAVTPEEALNESVQKLLEYATEINNVVVNNE
jgi:DNA-directed RNA polymerase subunit alpha